MSSANIQAMFQQALLLHQSGRQAEAEAAYQQIMRAAPNDYPSRCMLGRLRVEQGRLDEAVKLLQAAIQINGQAPQGHGFYGVALLRQRRFSEAVDAFRRVIALTPGDANAYRNLGDALRGQGQFAAAVEAYDRTLVLNPRAPDALGCRAEALLALGRPDEALRSIDAAMGLAPDMIAVLMGRATILTAMERYEEAAAAFGAVLARTPGEVSALVQRTRLLLLLQRPEEALGDLQAALRIDGCNVDLLLLYGDSLTQMRRYDQAVAAYDEALAVDATRSDLFFHRGVALEEIGAVEAAIDSYDHALALRPGDTASLNNRSGALTRLKRYGEARAGLEQILALEPDHIYAFGGLALCKLNACDWSHRDEIEAGLRERVSAGKVEVPPGILLSYLDDPALQLICARNYAALHAPDPVAYAGPSTAHERIRVAYLSADFHDHATARLAAALFEHHDRARFEVFGLSFGQDDGSAMRGWLKNAFEHFHDLRAMSDREILALMQKLEIDIAVDLKGYTEDARPQLFARRPAPLQVSYLGFPSTLGSKAYDYVLGDAVVTPMSLAPHFAEKIVQLPGCYQPNDPARPVPDAALTRKDAGLPENGVVFCSFNNNYKITPAFFDVWMRLLQAVDGSVLWLLEDTAEAGTNLRREASARGVEAQQLVFAPRVSANEHLARHHLADILLDTLPYGAHTTASDALWMGIPVVTCLGEALAGRVCASLCQAVGLSELVADDLEAYEAIALGLARDPKRLAGIKARLREQRLSLPLFDAGATCRGIEAAFETMERRHRGGLPPEAFSVGSS